MILITGAGLIGCHFARRVVDLGQEVVLYDLSPERDYIRKVVGEKGVHVMAGDMRDLPALLKTLQEFKVTIVVHTAGLIGGRVAENPYTGTTSNLLGTLHALEAVRLLDLSRLVYVSSRAAYDRSKIGEGAIQEDAPVGGHHFYNVTKACSELLIGAYSHHYRLDSLILRPGAVFGPGHYRGGSTVGIMMERLTLNILRGEPFEISAQDYFENEYVYAKDVALAIDLACNLKEPKHRVFNVGTGEVTGPHDIARAVKELFPEVEVTVAGSHRSETKMFPFDLTRSRTELGYAPQYPFKEALKDYVETLAGKRV